MIRAVARPRAAAAAQILLDDAGRRLDSLLLAPLRGVAGRDLVLVPTGPLQRVPWSLLPSLHGVAVTVAPSATLWHVAGTRAARHGGVVVAAGPGLPGAPAEADAVAALYETRPLTGDAATVADVTAALDDAALVHLATHGRLSAENPLFSHLMLTDGPLVAYDLEQLPALPHTVVLAACESGRNVVPTGDELLGLSAVFLAHGTTQVVGSTVPVPDAETTPLMCALHRRLSEGSTAAAALAQAQVEVRDASPAAAAAAAGFVCLGYGFASVPLTPETRQAHGRTLPLIVVMDDVPAPGAGTGSPVKAEDSLVDLSSQLEDASRARPWTPDLAASARR
jgi:hypothetical protein